MRALIVVGCVAALALVALAAGGTWDLDMARSAVKLEVTMNTDGTLEEIEYHVPLDQIPEPVRQRMQETFPNATLEDSGELEHVHGVLHYEVSAIETVNGQPLDRECMFRADGTPHSFELQVLESEVPGEVRQAIALAFPNATDIAWEKIVYGEDPNAAVSEYHVKVPSGGQNFKVVVAPSGAVLGAFLEIPAEIEVPVPLPR